MLALQTPLPELSSAQPGMVELILWVSDKAALPHDVSRQQSAALAPCQVDFDMLACLVFYVYRSCSIVLPAMQMWPADLII